MPGWIAAWPFLARFDPQLDPSNAALMTTGLWAGLVAAVLVELIWWFSGRFTDQRRTLWPAARRPAKLADGPAGEPQDVYSTQRSNSRPARMADPRHEHLCPTVRLERGHRRVTRRG